MQARVEGSKNVAKRFSTKSSRRVGIAVAVVASLFLSLSLSLSLSARQSSLGNVAIAVERKRGLMKTVLRLIAVIFRRHGAALATRLTERV